MRLGSRVVSVLTQAQKGLGSNAGSATSGADLHLPLSAALLRRS